MVWSYQWLNTILTASNKAPTPLQTLGIWEDVHTNKSKDHSAYPSNHHMYSHQATTKPYHHVMISKPMLVSQRAYLYTTYCFIAYTPHKYSLKLIFLVAHNQTKVFTRVFTLSTPTQTNEVQRRTIVILQNYI